MSTLEIRVRGTATEPERISAMQLVVVYEREMMPQKKPGKRNGVVWMYGNGDEVLVYHTKTAIVALWQSAARQSIPQAA